MAGQTVSDANIMEKGLVDLDVAESECSKPLTLRSRLTSLCSLMQRPKPREIHYLDVVEVQKLDKCQRGFPRLAAFQCSQDTYLLYRRFGYLQSRVLLEEQDKLRELEEKLEWLDEDLYAERDAYTGTRDIPSDKGDLKERRSTLMKEIGDACYRYSSLLVAASQVAALPRPAECDYRNVRSFCKMEPLCQAENSWVRRREDIITLKPGREHARLDDMIETILLWIHCPLIEWLFCSSETKQKTEARPKNEIIYYTRKRIDVLVNSVILFLLLGLLLVPIYSLYSLVGSFAEDKSDAAYMCILLAATLAFTEAMVLFTKAKRHEVLAAAAAYCAVLVVFLNAVPDITSNR